MDLNYYKKNFHTINQELINILGANDLATIYEIIDSISQYLEAKQQFQKQVGITPDIEKSL